MTKLYVDFNDHTGPGRLWLRHKMQPGGALPPLAPGERVILTEPGGDDEYEAVIAYDSSRRKWIADLDAPLTAEPASVAAGVAAAR